MTRLNAAGVMEGIPRISPNGRWLAIVKGVRGDFDVFIRSAQGGGPEIRVSQDSGSFPIWRADGREIFFRRTDGQLMAASIDDSSGEPRIGPSKGLFYCGRANITGQRWAVSPDGQRILLSEFDRKEPPPATVILNWDPFERQRN